MLKLFSRDKGAMTEVTSLSASEVTFIQEIAHPRLDATQDVRTLEKLSEALWNLCLWERQRTTSIDAKAAALTGLASLAATAVSVAGMIGSTPTVVEITSRIVSIACFIAAVVLSLNAQRVIELGGFFDEDIFQALGACSTPVGVTPKFKDDDEYKCFLREASIQRWLVFRNCNDANDAKARRLQLAQTVAALAVLSLLGVMASAWRE